LNGPSVCFFVELIFLFSGGISAIPDAEKIHLQGV
jgi:hypothetical protein